MQIEQPVDAAVPTLNGKWRKLRLASLAGVIAVILAACGGEVDTLLTLDRAGAGTRVMTVTVSASDVEEYASGGVGAINSVAASNLPTSLEFTPLVASGDSYVGGFTLTFDSPEDYRQKVLTLLADSGFTEQIQLSFTVADSVFLSGVTIDENFTSVDLLGWLTNALVAEGVVPQENASDILSSGSSILSYNGEDHALYYNQIQFSSGEVGGISSVLMTTTPTADGAWERTIRMAMNAEEYGGNKAAVDEYFADIADAGAVVTDASEDGGYEQVWEVSFSGDVAAITEFTALALSSNDVIFQFHEGAGGPRGLVSAMVLADQANCLNICGGSYPEDSIQAALVLPGSWSVAADNETPVSENVLDNGDLSISYSPDDTALSLLYSPALIDAAVDTKFGLTGSVSQTLTLTTGVLTEEEAESIVAGLDFGGGAATVTSVTDDDATVFTLEVSADSPEAFTELYPEAFPGGQFYFQDNGNFFVRDVSVVFDMNLAEIVGAQPPLDVTARYHLPFLQSAQDGYQTDSFLYFDEATGEINGAASFQYSGLTFIFMVILAVLIILILITILLLIMFRGRISAASARRREARDAQRQVAAAAATAYPGYAPTYPQGYPPAGQYAQAAGAPPTASASDEAALSGMTYGGPAQPAPAAENWGYPQPPVAADPNQGVVPPAQYDGVGAAGAAPSGPAAAVYSPADQNALYGYTQELPPAVPPQTTEEFPGWGGPQS